MVIAIIISSMMLICIIIKTNSLKMTTKLSLRDSVISLDHIGVLQSISNIVKILSPSIIFSRRFSADGIKFNA